MEIVSANNGSSDLRELFAHLLSSDEPEFREYGQRLIELLECLKNCCSGPRIVVGSTHSPTGFSLIPELFLQPQYISNRRIQSEFDVGVVLGLEPQPDYWRDFSRYVTVHAIHDGYRISYMWPEESNPIPWECSINFTTSQCIQAAIAIVHSLSKLLEPVAELIPMPRYRNSSSELQVRAMKHFVKCPHCDTIFSLNDIRAWDGKMHRVCEQRIRIVSS